MNLVQNISFTSSSQAPRIPGDQASISPGGNQSEKNSRRAERLASLILKNPEDECYIRIKNEITSQGIYSEEEVSKKIEETVHKLAAKAIKVLEKQSSEMQPSDREIFQPVKSKKCLTRLFGENKVFVHQKKEGKIKYRALGKKIAAGGENTIFLSIKIVKGKFEVYRKPNMYCDRYDLLREHVVHRELQSKDNLQRGIVKMKDTVEGLLQVSSFLEYCNGGDLHQRSKSLSAKQKVEILREVFGYVDIMHDYNYTHADLKAENILLITEISESGEEIIRPKLTDFSATFRTQNSLFGGTNPKLGGTPVYYSPEMFYSTNRNEACDRWALGIIAYELKHGKVPEFADKASTWAIVTPFVSRETFKESIEAGILEGIAALPSDTPYDRMIKGLLAYHPKDRMTLRGSLRVLEQVDTL